MLSTSSQVVSRVSWMRVKGEHLATLQLSMDSATVRWADADLAGLINPKCTAFIGSGVVVHIPSLFNELDTLERKGPSSLSLPSAAERLFSRS